MLPVILSFLFLLQTYWSWVLRAIEGDRGDKEAIMCLVTLKFGYSKDPIFVMVGMSLWINNVRESLLRVLIHCLTYKVSYFHVATHANTSSSSWSAHGWGMPGLECCPLSVSWHQIIDKCSEIVVLTCCWLSLVYHVTRRSWSRLHPSLSKCSMMHTHPLISLDKLLPIEHWSLSMRYWAWKTLHMTPNSMQFEW